MGDPLRIGLIGAGGHALQQHLPALFALGDDPVTPCRLTAVADPTPARLDAVKALCPGIAIWDSGDALLREASLDAVIVTTPPRWTAGYVRQAVARGYPVLMEKPLAPDLPTSEAIAREIAGKPVMVSLNRRFEPAYTALVEAIGDRRIASIEAEIARENRLDDDFTTATAIHVVDAALALVGPVALSGVVQEGAGLRATGRTAEGVTLSLLIAPRSGRNRERIIVRGALWEGRTASAFFDEGSWLLEERGLMIDQGRIDPSLPVWHRNGTLAETRAFLAMVAGHHPPHPTPADLLPAARLCAAIAAAG